jgi:hypothetical protein
VKNNISMFNRTLLIPQLLDADQLIDSTLYENVSDLYTQQPTLKGGPPTQVTVRDLPPPKPLLPVASTSYAKEDEDELPRDGEDPTIMAYNGHPLLAGKEYNRKYN